MPHENERIVNSPLGGLRRRMLPACRLRIENTQAGIRRRDLRPAILIASPGRDHTTTEIKASIGNSSPRRPHGRPASGWNAIARAARMSRSLNRPLLPTANHPRSTRSRSQTCGTRTSSHPSATVPKHFSAARISITVSTTAVPRHPRVPSSTTPLAPRSLLGLELPNSHRTHKRTNRPIDGVD